MKILKVVTVLILILFLSKGIAEADFTFGEPVNLGPMVNSQSGEYSAIFSTDGLEIFFVSNRSHPGAVTMDYFDIYVTKRANVDAPWSPAANLGPVVNSTLTDKDPFLTSDGLTLYFGSTRSEIWFSDLWMTTRASKDDDWGPPVNLGLPINSQGYTDETPSLTSDGLELYFASDRTGPNWHYNLWVTKRESIHDPWSEPVNLGPTVNGDYSNYSPAISPDGLVLIFNRGDVLWITKRASRMGNWSQPEKLETTVNFMNFNLNPNISPDGRWLLWSSANTYNAVDTYDVWKAPILPLVDFNIDGIVDSTDVCIMIDNWGTDEPLCDIGPMPWGDSIINVEDLIVLSEHLFEEVADPTLIAHWALDETEGMFAADSVGDNDAIVLGAIEWQPTSGQVDGALKLDGVSGYAITGTVLNPADGPFSVLAWVNGGAPGQVIVSQQGTANWLAVDTEGNLMTELKSSDQLAEPLLSEKVITDGQWHRIGLVWDGSHRTLYVDSIVVAEDTQDGLEASDSGLNIGAGKMTEPGSFFSGLIDDICIYNRAVIP